MTFLSAMRYPKVQAADDSFLSITISKFPCPKRLPEKRAVNTITNKAVFMVLYFKIEGKPVVLEIPIDFMVKLHVNRLPVYGTFV